MSLLAAAVPVAVLVLAWDEATPAVRALVEATETTAPVLDSVVVLVPAAAGELTQEEFLPLTVEPDLVATVASAEHPPEDAASEEDEAALATSPMAAPDPSPGTPAALSTLGASAAVPLAAPAALITAAPALLRWSAVRVLRLSSFSLPALAELSSQALPRPIWQSSVVAPAAPYVGSQLEAAQLGLSGSLGTKQLNVLPPAGSSLAAELATAHFPTPPATVPPEQLLPALPVPAPDYAAIESPVPAFDAEADLAPILPDELATSADAPLEAPLAETPSNAQAGWLEALDSLRDPLPIDEPAPATDLEDEATYYAATAGESQPAAGAGPAELRPPSQPFEAPNLNFQVIQYARFAVPVALAQLPFEVIYAPAWPTWLAAQELRYRTRQPLVLHVTSLAAGAEESLETATGWQAELQRQALHRADLILAETAALTHRLRHDLGLPPELVRTVPAADAAAVALALRTAQLRPNVNAS